MNIRTMTAADIPFAMRLKAQNNWNQLEADWRRQLDLEPSGCFVAEFQGTPVGTACACIFGDIAWINFVLVDQSQRGQGIGTMLMQHVVQYLDQRDVTCIRLDATPLGQPVYEKLAFAGEFKLDRFEGIFGIGADAVLHSFSGRRVGGEGAGHVANLLIEDLPTVFAMDEAITRTPRAKLLQHLHGAAPDRMHKYVRDGQLEGYCLCRPGANAWQIGPVQGSAEACTHLLLELTSRLAGERVYLDVPTDNKKAVEFVQTLSLKVQRSFLRMSRGRKVDENLELFWASSGPEKG